MPSINERTQHHLSRLSLSMPLLCSLLLLGGSLAHADVYKWVDEHGRVHYGDRPASKQTADRIEINTDSDATVETDPGSDAERKLKQQRLLQLFAEKREQKKKAEIDKKNEKITRQNECNKLIAYEKQILNSGYLYEEDERGNQTILTTEEFEQHLAETREHITAYCG